MSAFCRAALSHCSNAVVRGVSPLQSEGGEVSAVGNEAAAKNSEDPSAEAEESLERGEEEPMRTP